MELDRITLIKSHIDEHGTVWDMRCDLCDTKKSETKIPFISWPCIHDDNCIRTTVCSNCLAALRMYKKVLAFTP
jgi:hypothetical protein